MALTVAERVHRWSQNHPATLKERKAKWRDHLRENDICQWCQAAPALPDQVRCQSCTDKGKALRDAKQQAWLSLGLCGMCGRYPHLPAMSHKPRYRLCEECYIRKTAKETLGTMRQWRIIRQRLYDQEFKCAYTGMLLVLGENASLDHIYPQHTYPHLKSDPNNTEWVLREVNEMKRNRTPEQFLNLIQHILTYRAS